MAIRVKRLTLTEDEFLGQVIELAMRRGWLVHHQRPARTAQGWRSAIQGHAGFPDLVLVHLTQRRALFVELKMPGRGLTGMQQAWQEAFEAAGLTACLWTPNDWSAIERELE